MLASKNSMALCRKQVRRTQLEAFQTISFTNGDALRRRNDKLRSLTKTIRTFFFRIALSEARGGPLRAAGHEIKIENAYF